MQTRIYRALSVSELRRLGAGGVVEPAPFTAYAVTADLRREHPSSDEEELEYLAFTEAAASGALGGVRLLAAADVDEGDVSELFATDRPGRALCSVRVAAVVPRRQVVSFHVAEPAPGAPGSAGGLPAYSWYDATELDVVVDLLT